MKAQAKAEWHPLRKVVVHRPGIEMFFGLLEPYASLYERAFSRYEARREHEKLEYTLKQEFKIDILRLKETILSIADRNPRIREDLIKRAYQSVTFKGDKKEADLARKQMEKNTDVLDSGHFFNILLLHPLVDLETEPGARIIHLNVTEREPVSNLYFMRDQQAVTDKGIVLSRMSKPQRRREPLLTQFLWEILEAPVVHETQEPGTFEGGDFIPMGDFALMGIGDRTNRSGVEQMLASGLGFDEVGVVHQPNHPLIPGEKRDPMVDMHLDTYFNVASSSAVVGLELLLKNAKVEIYHREGGSYTKDKEETSLHDYIKGKGFDIIPITTLEQMSYASNFLCIRDGTILAVEVDRNVKDVLENLKTQVQSDPERYGKLLAQAEKDYESLKNEGQFFPHKKEIYQHGIDAYPLILPNLTGGYGGAHCMTCALKRG
ncbi:MAG: amidinotransferase [Theionarchaea archaeon]|nr:amidinotransferase [Theionarchaea archaeon]MBU7019541.1 amidinotransferase [Theionarchaea archaeon]MBU7036163.1 amidinotransferase [Theionarchaea archaeon]MBU7041598.1 amidinotransferase [Theionarchaea archaeon]